MSDDYNLSAEDAVRHMYGTEGGAYEGQDPERLADLSRQLGVEVTAVHDGPSCRCAASNGEWTAARIHDRVRGSRACVVGEDGVLHWLPW